MKYCYYISSIQPHLNLESETVSGSENEKCRMDYNPSNSDFKF